MSFIWPSGLLALFLIPILVWYYLRQLRVRRFARAVMGSAGSPWQGLQRVSGLRRHLPPFILLLGVSLLVLGLARPQMTVELPRVEGTVVLAFDVSNSMLAEDLQPSRLEAAKAAARSFVENQPTTVRIGVVAFGGSGLTLEKPTQDQAAILAAIDRLGPQGGTSLGEGLFASLNAIAGEALTIDQVASDEGAAAELRIDDFSSAVIVLLSDGENTEAPEPLEIAQWAAEAGVRVYTIGVGTAEGTPIEVEGFTIISALDEATLQQIAGLTNGAYFKADDEASLQSIYDQIDLQLTTRAEEMEITALSAGVSVLFLLAGAGLSLIWFGKVP